MMTMTADCPLQIILLYFLCACCSPQPVAQFPPPHDDPTTPGLIISTVVPSPAGDTIYVGTINNIFVLDVNLRPIHRIETGPLWDHEDCVLDSSNHRHCVSYRGANISTPELRDNRNLLLYVDPTDDGKLIACGSHRNGLCKYHSTSNLLEMHSTHRDAIRFSVSDDSSAVFFGPGPEKGKTFLWMAAFKRLKTLEKYETFLTNLGISTRSLDDGKVTVSPISDIVALSCDYSAEFIAGFGSSGFSYFLANMPAFIPSMKFPSTDCFGTKANVISKIIQVCQTDPTLKSYVEAPLSCSVENFDFTILEAATIMTPGKSLSESYRTSKLREISETDVDSKEEFIAAVLTSKSQPSKHALCFYPISWIRKVILKNLRRCFSDSLGETGFQFPNSRKCKTVHMEVKDDYCRPDGCDLVEGPISGMIGVNSVPSHVINTPDDVTAMTSVKVESVNTSHTIFVLGTNTGKLIKVLMETFDDSSVNRIYMMSKISSDDNTPVYKNIFISQDSKHLFVSTQRKVYKIPLSQCGQSSTCQSCLSSDDPLCGWCSLENRCSLQSACFSEGFDDSWLSFVGSKLDADLERCPSVISITPHVVNLDANIDNITFIVRNLPTKRGRDSSYRCSFTIDDRRIQTSIEATEQPQQQHHYHHRQLACSLIDLKGYLSDKTEGHNLEVKLYGSVEGKTRSSDGSLTSANYVIISCSSYKNCSGCIGKSSNPTCGWCFSGNKCTKTNRCDSLTEEQPLRNAKKCPRIVSQTETNLSAGISKNVEIKVKNLQEKSQRGHMEYFCKVDDVEKKASHFSNSSIQCRIDPIIWSGKQPKVTSIQVFGKDRNLLYPIENAFKMTVFNCSSMSYGDDCSLCQSLNLNEATMRFGCRWCEGGCKTSCNGREQATCPDPRIEEVRPLSGPMQGGTLITLYGTNLGVNLTKVTVGDIECSTLEISKKVVCRTNPSPRSTHNSPIKIQVDDKRPTTSSFTFAYLRPVIHSIHPNFGPVSGRTEVAIHGKDLTLDGEHDFNVYIGSECLVNQSASNSSRIVCKRNPMPGTQPSLPLEIPVSVKIDWANVSNEKVKFQVRGDPLIFKLDPSSTFESGGCSIHVYGLNLNASSTPIINIVGEDDGGGNVLVEPTFFNGTFMEFSFPRVRFGRVKLIFMFDEILISRPFEVTGDPVVNEYSALLDKHMLEIQGENLLGGCRVEEINVFVGDFECNLTELSDSSMSCQLHKNITTMLGGERHHINITLGNVELSLGRVQLFNKRPIISRVDTKLPILVGGIVGGLLIMAFMGVMIMMRKISSGRKRNNILIKRMQVLEKTISVQCKQSFAELQTHVSGFSSEISEAGIPYWDFRTYAFKFLFPMLKDHEVLRPPANTNAAMATRNERLFQLNQLLNNKSFLLTFVRTLEGHPKEFGIEDRSKIASWLTIVFLNNFEYLTIVMKELLEELIRKSLERNTQKMMLRRTESVVEKMLSNWLCLTMYHYIKVEVGKCLYRLCKAIEYQVDEGPVDAVTLESKFSLAEERLLRVKVDPQTLNVTIVGTDSCPVVCKLFDCDSITQAKCKAIKVLYKNKPHSVVPSPDNFELRLQVAGHDRGLLLKDEDNTSVRCNNDYIQLNTLKHYNIRNGSTLLLATVQKNSFEHDNVAVWKSQETMLFDSGSNWGTLKRSEVKNEPKLFHLVRQDDLTNNHFDGSEKLMSEVFLPRLLITKKALEDYIKRLFESMMSCDCNLPPTVKFLFDFFDATAQKYNIVDPDVVHIWKSNSLPLRFWVSVLRNPDFVFDVEKSSLVDPCLAVIAQVFIDGCSTHKHQLGLDSSSAKLLFANEMQSYKTQVENFYSSIQRMQPIDTNSMDAYLINVEREAENKFNTQAALHEVLAYVIKFQAQIQASLDEDVTCCSLKLPVKFNQMLS